MLYKRIFYGPFSLGCLLDTHLFYKVTYNFIDTIKFILILYIKKKLKKPTLAIQPQY